MKAHILVVDDEPRITSMWRRALAYEGYSVDVARTGSEALQKALEKPERPVAAIVGGAKISTKLDLLSNLLQKVDALIIGGAMANTFLLAQGKPVGKSLVEKDLVDTARKIMDEAKADKREIVLPVDVVVAKEFKANAPSRAVGVDAVGGDDMILDIGPRSVEFVCSVLARSKTLVWNGPFGAFETRPFDRGTVAAAPLPEAAGPMMGQRLQELAAQNPGAITEIIRPQPVFANGQQRGYRVYPGRNRQQFVKLGPARGDQVAVLSGVKPGEEIAYDYGTDYLKNVIGRSNCRCPRCRRRRSAPRTRPTVSARSRSRSWGGRTWASRRCSTAWWSASGRS